MTFKNEVCVFQIPVHKAGLDHASSKERKPEAYLGFKQIKLEFPLVFLYSAHLMIVN